MVANQLTVYPKRNQFTFSLIYEDPLITSCECMKTNQDMDDLRYF